MFERNLLSVCIAAAGPSTAGDHFMAQSVYGTAPGAWHIVMHGATRDFTMDTHRSLFPDVPNRGVSHAR